MKAFPAQPDEIGFDDDDGKSYCEGMTYDHHSRSDIVRLAGVDNDVLTFWLRQGLVRPIDAAVGRGKVLRFDRYQVRVARVLANGRAVGLNIDALKAIASALQDAIDKFKLSGVEPSALGHVIEEIEHPGGFKENLANARRTYERTKSESILKIIEMREAEGFEEQVVRAASLYSADDVDQLWLCVQLFDAEGYLIVHWDVRKGIWYVERQPDLSGSIMQSAACILIDLNHLADLPA